MLGGAAAPAKIYVKEKNGVMKILLDTANLDQISSVLPYMPIDGVTTNPTILSKESDDVYHTLSEMKRLMDGRMIHSQTTAYDCHGMLEQAKKLTDFIGPNFYIKIPMTLQGLRAVQMCKAEGLKVTVTAIFTPMQALLAAKCGADYVAPYVDRLDNITSDGVSVVGEIVRLLDNYCYDTQVLAASFKNVQQVYNVASQRAHTATVNAQLCEKLIFHPYTDKSLEDFDMDWRVKFGDKQITDFLEK